MPKPDPKDRRTRIGKLISLAETQKGTPEGDLARERAREKFKAGGRIFPFEVGQRMVIRGIPVAFQSESWDDDDPIPKAHFERVRPQNRVRFENVVIIQKGNPFQSAATTTTTTSWGPSRQSTFFHFHKE